MARALLVLGFVAALGCAADTTADCRVRSQVLVISAWRYTFPDSVPGIDLDHVVSEGLGASCTDAADFVSPVSGAPGVDNQFGTLVVPLLEGMLSGGSFSAAILEQLLRGEHVLGIELVSDASGLAGHLLVLEPADPLIADARGALEAGQRFVVVSRGEGVALCLGAGGLGFVVSSIEIPMGDPLGSLRVEGPRIRLLTELDGSIRQGELGGTLPLGSLVDSFGALGVSIDEATVRAVTQPDLLPRFDGTCEGVSLGVGLELVPAVVD